MAKEIRINDNEYAQILQQAVSEIQTARTTVARLYASPVVESAPREQQCADGESEEQLKNNDRAEQHPARNGIYVA